ncbi:hypothetical protein FGO68_gene11559 [Halteria grandinella]|uniref:Uncharacterized protein n=1 Tax=Halteria grandinella TaxID=5974 RepID=A0A8J8T207_HALGN|nr:hypothetical protein FGO68_gene11559 [Halteria grandinella]
MFCQRSASIRHCCARYIHRVRYHLSDTLQALPPFLVMGFLYRPQRFPFSYKLFPAWGYALSGYQIRRCCSLRSCHGQCRPKSSANTWDRRCGAP